jgi:hypothetical protein
MLMKILLVVMLLMVPASASAGETIEPGATVWGSPWGSTIVGDVEVRYGDQSIKVYEYDGNPSLRGEVTSISRDMKVYAQWGGSIYSPNPHPPANERTPTYIELACAELFFGCGGFCRGVALHTASIVGDTLKVESKYLDPKMCLPKKNCTYMPLLAR